MENEPIIIELILNSGTDKVWDALTRKEQMKIWYFDLPEFKAEVGFEFEFEAGDEIKMYLHLCKIIEAVDGEKLRHSWRYDGYEGNSFVTWELFAEGEQTRLKFIHEGLESFPESNPDLAKNNFVAGWNEIVGNSLPNFLKDKSGL